MLPIDHLKKKGSENSRSSQEEEPDELFTCSSSSSTTITNSFQSSLSSLQSIDSNKKITTAISTFHKPNIITSTRLVDTFIPESKSQNILSNHLLFSCQVQCRHYIHYKLEQEYKQYNLAKLDIILNPSSSINIQCIFLLNGIENLLEYPSLWIKPPLNKVMENNGFEFIKQQDDCFQYHVNKAFVTSPLSYILGKQVPHGTLERFELVFDWSTTKSKEFQSLWKKKLDSTVFFKYLQSAITSVITTKSCYMYPLIFSSAYTKRITQTMAYLPCISQSLLKIYTTSKVTMSVSNHEFSQSFINKIKAIQENTKIMNPYCSEDELSTNDIMTSLTLGMYHSVKNANKPKYTMKSKKNEPPNALYTVAQLWTITACSSNE